MKKRIVFIAMMLFAAVGFLAGCSKKAEKETGVYYTCPMHPEVKKDEPGKCPICSMELVRMEDPAHRHM